MASSLPSTLAVPGTGFHAKSKVSSLFQGASLRQLPLQPSCIVRGGSSCDGISRRPLLLAAVGGSSSESVVEAEKPSTSTSTEDREQARANRRRKGFEEYEILKKDLSSTTIGVAAAVDAYIFLTLSPQTAVSYTIGAVGSYLYLQLLFRHADSVSEENIAEIFQKRRKKTIGIRSSDVHESLEKTIRGCGISLSSPRLVIPAALYSLWAISTHFTGTSSDSFHLEVAPLMLGFFAYKAAALIQAYRDNKDLLMIIATGQISGVIDDRGKFLYILREEMKAVADYIKRLGRVSIAHLASKSNEFIDLEPKTLETDMISCGEEMEEPSPNFESAGAAISVS